ncbi:MAG: GAF domain-containing protein [Spirochaetes bacterium]|nr:GAF domain-containing protein [Spirochaetota bacterium]
MNTAEDQINSQDIEKQLSNINKLLEINSIINSTLDIGKLLNIIMEIIKDIMNAEASTLFLFEEKTQDLVFKVALGEAGKELAEKQRVKIGQGVAGWVAEKRKPVYINNVYEDERFDPNYDKITGFNSKAILCVPLLFKGKLIGVIQAINPTDREGFDDNDLILFSAFAEQAVLAVQNAIFFKEAIEEQRIRTEIGSAQSFHNSLLPAVDKKYKNIQIAARAIPARELGGEFYDISCFDDSIGLALGDCHIKGIPGALNASILLGAVKGLSSVLHSSPSKLINNLNKSISGSIQIMSLFYGTISCTQKTIQFVNIGFAYPIIVRKNVARYLKFTSSPEMTDLPPQKISVVLEPDDFFVVVTDGIVNLKNRGAQNLGLKRIMDHLTGDFNTPKEIVDSLTKLADDFLDGLEKRQDISIIVFKIEK